MLENGVVEKPCNCEVTVYTEGTVMVYAVPEEKKNRVTARTVYTEVRVNRGEGVY